jgi:hypothetical protein
MAFGFGPPKASGKNFKVRWSREPQCPSCGKRMGRTRVAQTNAGRHFDHKLLEVIGTNKDSPIVNYFCNNCGFSLWLPWDKPPLQTEWVMSVPW